MSVYKDGRWDLQKPTQATQYLNGFNQDWLNESHTPFFITGICLMHANNGIWITTGPHFGLPTSTPVKLDERLRLFCWRIFEAHNLLRSQHHISDGHRNILRTSLSEMTLIYTIYEFDYLFVYRLTGISMKWSQFLKVSVACGLYWFGRILHSGWHGLVSSTSWNDPRFGRIQTKS